MKHIMILFLFIATSLIPRIAEAGELEFIEVCGQPKGWWFFGYWTGTISYSFVDEWTEQEKDVIREAFSRWESLPESNIQFQEISDSDTVNIRFKWTPRWQLPPNERTGEYPIAIRHINRDASSSVGIQFAKNPGERTEWNFDISSEIIPTSKYDLLTAAMHEIGHALWCKRTRSLCSKVHF